MVNFKSLVWSLQLIKVILLFFWYILAVTAIALLCHLFCMGMLAVSGSLISKGLLVLLFGRLQHEI